jgi:indole-3-glycerol phosphate synthase
MTNDDLENENQPSALSIQVAEMLMEDFSKTHTHKDDINDETLPYEFSVNIPVKQNSASLTQVIDEYVHTADEFAATAESPYDPASDYPKSLDFPQSRVFSSKLQDEIIVTRIPSGSNNVLEEICNAKREHIAEQKAAISESKLREHIYLIEHPRGFLSAINAKIAVGQNALISEIKKASPSRGVIREDFEPGMIAKAYEAGGATCISVLTDKPYFQGKDEYIDVVKRSSSLPVLRKDFILDVYQVVESRALGADCILLIMAALGDEEAIMLEEEAIALGLDVLAEVHNEEELQRALKLKTMLIGINNRDLKTLKIDLANTERLAALIPFPRVVICESGIYSHEDIRRMNNSNVHTFLVGESLMVQDDIKGATELLLGNAF